MPWLQGVTHGRGRVRYLVHPNQRKKGIPPSQSHATPKYIPVAYPVKPILSAVRHWYGRTRGKMSTSHPQSNQFLVWGAPVQSDVGTGGIHFYRNCCSSKVVHTTITSSVDAP